MQCARRITRRQRLTDERALVYGPNMARSSSSRLKWFGSGALALLLLIACASATFIVQQYDGDPLPAERIAILRLVGGEEGYLATLDGENLDYRVEGRTDRIHIEMLPGRHEIGVSLRPLGLVVYRVFDARGGMTYQFKVLHSKLQRGMRGRQSWSVGIFEVDASGELGRDVSSSPLPPAPLTVPPPAGAPTPDGAGGAPTRAEEEAGGQEAAGEGGASAAPMPAGNVGGAGGLAPAPAATTPAPAPAGTSPTPTLPAPPRPAPAPTASPPPSGTPSTQSPPAKQAPAAAPAPLRPSATPAPAPSP